MQKKIIIFMTLMVTILSGAMIMNSRTGKKVDNNVRTVKISSGSLNENLIFEGTVVPENMIPIYVNTPAVVDRVYVNEGSIVSKGEKLVSFGGSAKSELKRALEVNKLDLEGVALQLKDLESGSMKLELDNRQLDIKSLEEKRKTLTREIKAATYEAKNLRKQADIKMKLLANDGISSIEATKAISIANKKEVELENLKTDLNLTSQKYQLAIQGLDRLKRELNLEATKIRGEYKKLTLAREALQEKIDAIGKPLVALEDGVVVDMKIVDGSPVREGQTMLYIAATGNNHIKLDVPFYQAKWLESGQKAIVKSKDGFEDKEYIGNVSSVSKVAKVVKNGKYEDRVVEVEVSLENPQGLKPGFLAEVEIEGTQKDNTLLVDAFSVVEEEGANYVYIVENGVARKMLVEVGAKTISEYEVLNLPMGTEVVSNPFKIKDGQKVAVKNRMGL